jgi:hypothetical protein
VPFPWYNPDPTNNGGFAGYINGGSCSGSDCDTDGFVRAVNAQGLCGARDWRLPSDLELLSIVSNDRYSPAIDTGWFPNMPSYWFWSSSPSAVDSYGAFCVGFDHGNVGYYEPKGNAKYVRLVRGGQ